MELLKGNIELANGLSLTDAIVRVESITDNNNAEYSTIPRTATDETGREYMKLEYEMRSNRHVQFTAQVFVNEKMLKENKPVGYITQEDGRVHLSMTPSPEQSGNELLDLALNVLQKRYPELTPF